MPRSYSSLSAARNGQYNLPNTMTETYSVDEIFKRAESLRIMGRYKEALPLLEQAAQENYPPAFSSLWTLYFIGGYLGPRNIEKETYYRQKIEDNIAWFKANANLGNSDAQHCLSVFYSLGLGVEENQDNLFYWAKKSAEQRHPIALCNLGKLYQSENRARQDLVRAVHCFEHAANKGYTQAYIQLGKCYEYAIGVIENKHLAFTYYERAAKANDPQGQYILGQCYFYGNCIAQNNSEAVRWTRLAAEKEYVCAQVFYGALFADGDRVEKNQVEAVRWYRKAAEQNDPMAEEFLGDCYLEGVGVSINKTQAIEYYRQSLEHGNENVRENLEKILGQVELESHQKPLRQNEKRDPQTKQQQAEQAFQQGMKYYQGVNTAKNEQLARPHLQHAAELDHVEGQYRLGTLYLHGIGDSASTQKSAEEKQLAFEWLLKAAKKNHADAQFELADCYQKGIGVIADSFQSVVWFKRAVANGCLAPKQYLPAESEMLFQEVNSCLKNKRVQGRGVDPTASQKKIESRRALEQSRRFFFAKDKPRLSWTESRAQKRQFSETRRQAKRGVASAQFELAECYRLASGVNYKCDKMIKWYKRAAENNYVKAQHYLGLYYEKTERERCGYRDSYAPPTAEDAARYYKMAVNQGHVDSLLRLGLILMNRPGCEHMQYFRKAVELGDIEAEYYIGLCYEQGKGVSKNYSLAVEWYKSSANKYSSRSRNKLGRHFEMQIGSRNYLEQAFANYSHVSADEFSEAKTFLGFCFQTGYKKEKNVKKAIELYKSAAYNKYFPAEYLLVLLKFSYYKDQVKSLELLSGRNCVDAQYRLGCIYFKDKKNYRQAEQQLIKAADNGHLDALYKLGLIYQERLKLKEIFTRRNPKYYDLFKPVTTQTNNLFCRDGVHAIGEEEHAIYRTTHELVCRTFKKAEERGHIGAIYSVGECYENGVGVEANSMLAFEKYNSIDNDFPAAITGIGRLYQRGFEKGKSIATAVELYEKAKKLNDKIAEYHLGLCYETGAGVSKNSEKAVQYYKSSADKGYLDAQVKLVELCIDDKTSSPELSYKRWAEYGYIEKWCEVLARSGDVQANYFLGCRRSVDLVGLVNNRYNYCLYAAQKGHANAQFKLAQFFDDGTQSAQCLSKAVEWYLKAADQGHVDAQFKLAQFFDDGAQSAQCLSKAVEWYLKAADQGHVDAQIKVARSYHYGFGSAIKINYEQALFWYRKAQSSSNENIGSIITDLEYFVERLKSANVGHADAQFDVGNYYQNGVGIKENKMEAVRWYHKAAEQEHIEAQYQLASCYEQGQVGTAINMLEAIAWYQRAARGNHKKAISYCNKKHEQWADIENCHRFEKLKVKAEAGDALVQKKLAQHYENGTSVEKDPKQAFYWYQQSANQKHPGGLYCLARCFENGIGVEFDYLYAIENYERAVLAGNTIAEQRITTPSSKIRLLMKKHSVTTVPYKSFLSTLIEADKGVTNAQRELGQHFLQECEYTKSEKWLQLAAKKNDEVALSLLGWIYSQGFVNTRSTYSLNNGKTFDVEMKQNNHKATEMYRKLISIGADKYQSSLKQSEKKLAAEENLLIKYEIETVPDGEFIAMLKKVDDGAISGFRFFKEKAEKNNADAQHYLSRIYQHYVCTCNDGKCIQRACICPSLCNTVSDYSTPQRRYARNRWCRKAAENGHVAAKNILPIYEREEHEREIRRQENTASSYKGSSSSYSNSGTTYNVTPGSSYTKREETSWHERSTTLDYAAIDREAEEERNRKFDERIAREERRRDKEKCYDISDNGTSQDERERIRKKHGWF